MSDKTVSHSDSHMKHQVVPIGARHLAPYVTQSTVTANNGGHLSQQQTRDMLLRIARDD